MPHKFLFLSLIFIILLGLYYYATTAKPLPLYAFASTSAGNGDIFIMASNGQLRNLTHDPSGDWDAAWSPNGKTLAFTSHRSGNSDIWLIKVDGQTPPQNLTNDPSWDYSPTWSPNGQRVAFVSERDGDYEIFVQDISADKAIQLTFNHEMDRSPAWSPNGNSIAFAAVREGVERIHAMHPDGTAEQVMTSQIEGTAPAWSPDSTQVAFIGWDKQNRAGIYTIDLKTNNLSQHYHGRAWLGSLDWSADGPWLTFTSWEAGNHEIYALQANLANPTPYRLTCQAAWDDFLTFNPQAKFSPTNCTAPAKPTPLPQTNLIKGLSLADLSKAYLVNDVGFAWAKGLVNWATVEPKRGKFRWVDPDNVVKAFGDQHLKILMRIHGTPDWAKPAKTILSQPPDDLADFGTFLTAVATRYRGKIAAYEIWNEPNLTYEWGNQSPDPTTYTAMLKTAYQAIKQADPDALVISGGLATTGNGSPTAMGDLVFLQGMYTAGAQGYFDAFGSHAYTFGNSPDLVDPYGLSLSRVVEQHQVMTTNGDSDTPIWITETGCAIKTHWDLGIHSIGNVTEAQQAEYLARLYEKVPRDWPFVKAVFLFNLDFSTVSWYPTHEQMRWYAILNPDQTPRPAYIELGSRK